MSGDTHFPRIIRLGLGGKSVHQENVSVPDSTGLAKLHFLELI